MESKGFMFLPSVKYVVVYCGINNVQHEEPKATANSLIETDKVFQRKSSGIDIVLTDFLRRY